MSGSGEHGTPQPVPGPAATAIRREEETDAAPCERERGTEPVDSVGTDRFHNDDEPSAELVGVIALSPRTLMSTTTTTTGRFACELCGKGFLRDQSLQLHRRGHAQHDNSLRPPRHGGGGGRRAFAYVCPVASCARHDPGRVPGELAGIRSHYRRRHGEMKWKCDLCGRRYAADHDWGAHAMVCGTREHRCGCGAVFSREDSFVTHRAFCDALAQQPTNAATVASALHRLALPSQADGRLATKDLKPWMPVVRADDGGSSSGGGFARVQFKRGDDRVGCVAGACTRPEFPPRSSLSRPVLEAAARAHAVAYQHECESCREFLINADKSR